MDPIDPILPSRLGIPRIEPAPATPPVRREVRDRAQSDGGARRQRRDHAQADAGDDDGLAERGDARRDLAVPEAAESEPRGRDDEAGSGPHIDILA